MAILSTCCDHLVIFSDICSECHEHCDTYDTEEELEPVR